MAVSTYYWQTLYQDVTYIVLRVYIVLKHADSGAMHYACYEKKTLDKKMLYIYFVGLSRTKKFWTFNICHDFKRFGKLYGIKSCLNRLRSLLLFFLFRIISEFQCGGLRIGILVLAGKLCNPFEVFA